MLKRGSCEHVSQIIIGLHAGGNLHTRVKSSEQAVACSCIRNVVIESSWPSNALLADFTIARTLSVIANFELSK